MVSLSRVGFLGRIGGIGGNLLSYTLRALFNRADTGVLAAGDLEVQAPGSVQDGSIVIDDTSTGTVEVMGNELKVVGPNAWDTTGFHSATPVPRVIGNVIGMDLRYNLTNKQAIITVNNSANHLLANNEWYLGQASGSATGLVMKIVGGAAIKIADYAAATTYNVRFVLGGYDINGVPYKSGDTKANFTYGVAVFIKGGAFTAYTLLWKTSVGSAANLYAGLNALHSTGQYFVDNIVAPVADKSAVLQPVHLDTFTDVNGTNITAHTPDVGGSATVLSGTLNIQSNQINAVSNTGGEASVVYTAPSDGLFEVITKQAIGSDGIRFRSVDVNNTWLARAAGTSGLLELYDRQAGTWTLRASVAITKAIDGKITVITDGPTITAFYNDTQTITFTSALYQTATIAGPYTDFVGNKLDNFAIYNRTAPAYDAALGGF